jgi:hypothetical protein
MLLASTKKKFFRVFGIVFLILLLIPIFVIAKVMDDQKRELLEVERVSLVDKGEKVFTPKELLNAKNAYQGKPLSIRAQVYQEPITCEKRTCSEGDKCCGCAQTRDLLAQDFRVGIGEEGLAESLRLKKTDGLAFCERAKNSCNYDCGDWKIGGIYDIAGTFNATSGPAGWNRPTGLYLVVSGKNLLQVIGFQDNIGRLIERFSLVIGSFGGSGTYILP